MSYLTCTARLRCDECGTDFEADVDTGAPYSVADAIDSAVSNATDGLVREKTGEHLCPTCADRYLTRLYES